MAENNQLVLAAQNDYVTALTHFDEAVSKLADQIDKYVGNFDKYKDKAEDVIKQLSKVGIKIGEIDFGKVKAFAEEFSENFRIASGAVGIFTDSFRAAQLARERNPMGLPDGLDETINTVKGYADKISKGFLKAGDIIGQVDSALAKVGITDGKPGGFLSDAKGYADQYGRDFGTASNILGGMLPKEQQPGDTSMNLEGQAENYEALKTMHADYSNTIMAQEADKKSFTLGVASDMVSSAASTFDAIIAITGKEGRTVFEIQKGFAIAQTLMKTYEGAIAARAALSWIPGVGPALGTAAYYATLAAGVMQAKKIAELKPGSSSSGAGAGGGISVPSASSSNTSLGGYPQPAAVEAKPKQDITVIVNSPLADQNWAKIAEENIVPAINAAGQRNVKISINAVGA